MVMLLLACAAPTAPCVPSAATIWPEDGDVDVPPDTRPTVALADPAAEPRLWVDGGVTGTWTDDGAGTWTLAPDAPLSRARTYTVLADVCGEETTSTFTTLGAPVGGLAVGSVFRMELDAPDIAWVQPTQLALVAEYLRETDSLVFAVTEVADGRLTLVMAAGWEPETDGRFAQYPCVEPVALDADFALDPTFSAGPVDTALHTVEDTGQSFKLYDFVVTGEIAQDGSALLDLTLAGLLDVSGVNVGAGTVCEFAPREHPCQPCYEGAPDATCLPAIVTDPVAPAVDIAFVDEIAPDACP